MPISALAAQATTPKGVPRSRRLTRYQGELWLLLAPFVLGAILLIILPVLLTIVFAFTEYDAFSAPVWSGLRNFGTIFRRELFWVAVRNSLTFVALSAPLQLLGALLLALLLYHQRAGVRQYRISAYLPSVIPDVAYALIWLWIFNPLYGPLNKGLAYWGLPQPAWLVDADTALLSLVLMTCFRVGEGMLVLIAALQGVPATYFQVAALDGGNRWQCFRYITLPLVAPWLLMLLIRDILLSAQSTFTPVYMMTEGGPGYATTLLPYLIYDEAFSHFRIGHAASMMVVMFVGIGVLLWLVYKLAGGWGYTDEM
ncbi:MAG: sugar ABC transporter permease [Caldilineaceae bacterium]|nr:sugar ABC transporter permease [Caldilineaceae bacterium]